MKKLFIAIVALLYISTSSGAVVHLHYCMGKLVGLGLVDNMSTSGGGCDMDKKDNGCCKHYHKVLKNDSDQKPCKAVQLIQLLAETIPISYIEISSADFISVTQENRISHATSRNNGIAVYIRNCVFLI